MRGMGMNGCCGGRGIGMMLFTGAGLVLLLLAVFWLSKRIRR